MSGLAGRSAFALVAGAAALLPRRLVLKAGEALGSAAYAVDRRHREVALKNLRAAFGPALDDASRRHIARDSFRSFGRLAADIVKLTTWPTRRIDRLVDVSGLEHLRGALAGGRGALLVTGHLGNWEVGARPLSRVAPLSVIARRLDSSTLERSLLRLRTRLGMRVVYKKQASRRVLQALRANELVAVLIDQNVLRSEGVFVDFFGRPASTTPAAAVFHLRTGAPVLPTFCLPAPGGRYRLEIRPPLEPPPPGNPEAAVLTLTGRLTKMLEAEIRRAPGLWLWFHDRWRSRPAAGGT